MPNLTKLDKVFSEYIRRRDSDASGYGKCISSGKIIHWKDGDAGHWINRRHMATRYDEQNVNLQSRSDNRFSEGNFEGYRRGLIAKYGEDVPEKLYIKKFNICHLSQNEVNLLTKYYVNKIKELKK